MENSYNTKQGELILSLLITISSLLKKGPEEGPCFRIIGAGNGSRTHLSTLGRSHSTDELYPQILLLKVYTFYMLSSRDI